MFFQFFTVQMRKAQLQLQSRFNVKSCSIQDKLAHLVELEVGKQVSLALLHVCCVENILIFMGNLPN
ncbi:hypothetical protein P9112_002282 [Eukaryota sp. TZLM1-RC]